MTDLVLTKVINTFQFEIDDASAYNLDDMVLETPTSINDVTLEQINRADVFKITVENGDARYSWVKPSSNAFGHLFPENSEGNFEYKRNQKQWSITAVTGTVLVTVSLAEILER